MCFVLQFFQRVNISLTSNKLGEPQFFVLIRKDIEQRKQMKEEVVVSNLECSDSEGVVEDRESDAAAQSPRVQRTSVHFDVSNVISEMDLERNEMDLEIGVSKKDEVEVRIGPETTGIGQEITADAQLGEQPTDRPWGLNQRDSWQAGHIERDML